MHTDRMLYQLLLTTITLLLVIGVALPATMQDDAGPVAIPVDAFELTGTLESITNQQITVDGITVDISIADLNTRLTLGDRVRIEGSLNGGIYTARRVNQAIAPPQSTPSSPQGNESSGMDDNHEDDFEFRGMIEAVDDGFVIVSGQRVELVNTEIEIPLAVGQFVKVEGAIENGILTAREIEHPDINGLFDDDRDDRFGDDDLNISQDCVITTPAGWVRYTVRPGETISSIAARSGSQVAELTQVNCLDNPRFILAGSTLLLPRIPTSFPNNRGGNESSGSDSRSFPNNSGGGGGGNESSGSNSWSNSASNSRSFPNNSGGNESSGSNSASNSASNSWSSSGSDS